MLNVTFELPSANSAFINRVKKYGRFALEMSLYYYANII